MSNTHKIKNSFLKGFVAQSCDPGSFKTRKVESPHKFSSTFVY